MNTCNCANCNCGDCGCGDNSKPKCNGGGCTC